MQMKEQRLEILPNKPQASEAGGWHGQLGTALSFSGDLFLCHTADGQWKELPRSLHCYGSQSLNQSAVIVEESQQAHGQVGGETDPALFPSHCWLCVFWHKHSLNTLKEAEQIVWLEAEGFSMRRKDPARMRNSDLLFIFLRCEEKLPGPLSCFDHWLSMTTNILSHLEWLTYFKTVPVWGDSRGAKDLAYLQKAPLKLQWVPGCNWAQHRG